MGSVKEHSPTHGAQTPFLEIGQHKEAINRINTGYQNLTELSNCIKERASIEESYSTHLKKWANKYGEVVRKGGEYNTCRTAWMETLQEARALAEVHTVMSKALVTQAQKKISNHQKDNYTKKVLGGFKQVATYEKEFAKAQQNWQSIYKKQVKAKQAYYDSCISQRTAEKNLEGFHAAIESAKSSGGNEDAAQTKYDKQKTLVHKKEEEVVKTRDNYRQAVIHCDDARAAYEDDMKNVYDKTQDDEEKRLNFVREIFFDVHQKLNLADDQRIREIYTNNETALLKLDVKSDIDWWHNTRGMGVAMCWPSFEEYDPQSAQNTIAHKQSQRASKHVAGASGISTMSYKQNSGTSFAEEFNTSSAAAPPYRSPVKDSLDTTLSSGNPFDSNNNKISGNAGDAGQPAVEAVDVEAVYEYAAQEADEISLVAGMRLMQIEPEDDQGWCKGRLPNGSEGLYPANYVRVV